MEFKGKTAIVTGAAVGIGRAVALRLAMGGANVVAVDLDEENLNLLKAELSEYAPKTLTFVCDVSDAEAVNKVVGEVTDQFGKIDILINNAGLWRFKTPFVETSMDLWGKLIDVNVMGTVYFTRAVIEQMVENQYGRIINVASVAGVYGNRNMVPYSTTKGAIISFTKALAKEVAENGVTVNAVSPGTVSPSVNHDIDFTKPSKASYAGRTGSDSENAELICFLASDKAGYICGENILIDGCRKML